MPGLKPGMTTECGDIPQRRRATCLDAAFIASSELDCPITTCWMYFCRMVDISCRVMHQIGLDDSTFNIEYFWDSERDSLNIVEINPRLSQSHAPLFEYVDGVPNHQSMINLALGRDPELPHGKGPFKVAGKVFLRRFEDGCVRRAPGPEDLARVESEMPDAIVDVVAVEGVRLSGLPMQDSYSYELANVYLGAGDQSELEEKHQRCVELLPFEFYE